VLEKPSFLQGVFTFEGQGIQKPISLQPGTQYKVPFDKRSQMVYFRAGNASAELVYFLMKRDGKPMRYFPVGAKESVHVPLAVVEDLTPETTIEVLIAAPEGIKGSVVLDIGFMEF
jgi:hypothetical protein